MFEYEDIDRLVEEERAIFEFRSYHNYLIETGKYQDRIPLVPCLHEGTDDNHNSCEPGRAFHVAICWDPGCNHFGDLERFCQYHFDRQYEWMYAEKSARAQEEGGVEAYLTNLREELILELEQERCCQNSSSIWERL